MVHRAIRKLRLEERNKHRGWLSSLKAKEKVRGADYYQSDSEGDDDEEIGDPNSLRERGDSIFDEDDEDFDVDPEATKKMSPMMAAIAAKKRNSMAMTRKKSTKVHTDMFGIATSLMSTTGGIKKLKKMAAKPSWYSQYKEHFAYEHRIQRDGFEFIFEYKAQFGNTLKSFFPTQVMDVDKTVVGIGSQIAFVSLDKNGFNYWETSSTDHRAHMTKRWPPPVTKKRVHFKRRQNEFIQSLCYIPVKNMYIGAGLDMRVHIYDRNLNYITALPTGERVIRHIIYNAKLDEVIIAGSGGCKSWKITRHYTKGSNVFNLTVFRNYTKNKHGQTHWVSHIEFDNDSQRLICIEDDTINCIDCETGKLVSKLRKIHEAPLTGCVWYHRSQYFITSCAGGLVKVWAVHHDSNMKFGKQDFALLHTFTGHTKAVTALQMHPQSGLAVSVSLDGTLRVLNLEALEEIYAIQIMQPLIAMKCVKIGEHSLCVGATIDGTIRVWSINSFLGFFGVCRAACDSRTCIYDPDDNDKMAAVVTAGEEIRVFNEKGMLISNLLPGKLDGEKIR